MFPKASLFLKALRESRGTAIAVTDEEILESQKILAKQTGILLCPEGAATAAALIKARQNGTITAGAKVVLFNCASGLKYPMPGLVQAFEPGQDIATVLD